MLKDSRPPTVLFVCTEDWFFHSHFLPLVKAARQADEKAGIALVANTGRKRGAIERMGVTVIPFDFRRGSLHPLVVRRTARRLRSTIQRVQPDIVHFISLTPVLLAVLGRVRHPRTIFHVTGLGTLAELNAPHFRVLRATLFRLLGRHVRANKCAMLFENPDDLDYLRKFGLPADIDSTILRGAGLDLDWFCPLPDPGDDDVRVAFVGRLISTKGVDVLIEAMNMPELRERGVSLDIYGKPDTNNFGAIPERQLRAWAELEHVHWHGHVSDVRGIWRRAAICVVPTRTREGMPRAMLEAAACARPLVVTDVPGCRHFVRDGVEGFVVPPEDPGALAEAIARLAADRGLRERMGQAARRRIEEEASEERIIEAVVELYGRMLQS